MTRYFAIEGNIGAGKTCILKEIQKLRPDWGIIDEPLTAFTHYSKFNPLYESYSMPEKNAAISQIHIIDSSLNHYKKNAKRDKEITVSERSVLSSNLFIEVNKDMGIFSDFVATFLYNYLEKNLTEDHIIPEVTFYLDIDPMICQERTQRRNRLGENECSSKFFDQFHFVAKSEPFVHISCYPWSSPLEIAKELVEIMSSNKF